MIRMQVCHPALHITLLCFIFGPNYRCDPHAGQGRNASKSCTLRLCAAIFGSCWDGSVMIIFPR